MSPQTNSGMNQQMRLNSEQRRVTTGVNSQFNNLFSQGEYNGQNNQFESPKQGPNMYSGQGSHIMATGG